MHPVAAAPSQVDERAAVAGTASILCDSSGRLGELSYQVPEGMLVRVGDAVHVPFGRRETYGLVVGAGNQVKATRPIIEVLGRRAHPLDIEVARTLAERHFADLATVAPRLSPKAGRGHAPIVAGPVVHTGPVVDVDLENAARRRLLVRGPLLDPAALAAQEAARLAATTDDGQVLVLCPTVELVKSVRDQFASGAERLDAKARKGAWGGFVEGSVKIGIGTRASCLFSAPNLVAVIVVEEEHPGHIEATMPHWHARDVALARATAHDIACVLISAVPSPQALAAGCAVQQVGRKQWPKMSLISRRDQDPGQWAVPPMLRSLLSKAEKSGRKAVVLAQRKAATRRCARCGFARPCEECTSSLCRHVETRSCPQCEQPAGVRMSGWDVDRLTALLGRSATVVSLPELVELRDVGVVVLFDIDAALRVPGMTEEGMASYLIMVGARAAGSDGVLAAVTEDPTTPVLRDYFVRQDQLEVARRSWKAARDAGLPPFGRLVTLTVTGAAAPDVTSWPGTVYGPRRTGDEWEIVVRTEKDEVGRLRPHIERLRKAHKVRLTVT